MKKANPPHHQLLATRHHAVGAFLLLTSYFLLSTPAFAAKEALLIANAEYTNFGKLPNPIPDARKLADSLRQIGFQVALVENADREQMLDALGTFEERLKASRGIAFFHYGGHGVQVNGRNYLIPANADIPDEKRVATRAVELDEVMTALDASGSAANIVVLDACRDNPLPASTRSATRGLSVVQAKPKNSIIIYAAEAGSKAQDGLFTPILANAITAPGRSITDVVMQVRRQVNEQSGGTQTPGEYNQLFEQLVLTAGTTSTLLPAPQAPPPAPVAYQPPQIQHPEPVQIGPQNDALIREAPQIEEELGLDEPPNGFESRDLSGVKSYWNHNGSVVGLIPEGKSRIFVYVKPREGLKGLVQPGDILFSGISNNNSYVGTARRFRKGLPPILYDASGPIKKGGSQVNLMGVVTLREADGSPGKTINDTLVFDLMH
jgi:hypothetical protein